jgi:hypothetical protein
LGLITIPAKATPPRVHPHFAAPNTCIFFLSYS